MVVRINDKRMFMWRAVDSEGGVLNVLVQQRRNKAAALKLLRKLLKNQGFVPEAVVTDGLASYQAAMRYLGWCEVRFQVPDPTRRLAVNLTMPLRLTIPSSRFSHLPDWARIACDHIVGRE